MTAPARDALRRGEELRRLAHGTVKGDARLRDDVAGAFRTLRAQMVRRELGTIPVARLRDATEGRLRLGRLEHAGYTTVLHVYQATPEQLAGLPGVGPATATQAVGAARQMASAVDEGLKFHVDLDPQNKASTALLVALHRLRTAEEELSGVRDNAGRLDLELPGLLATAGPAGSRLRMVFAGRKRRDQARVALSRVRVLLDWAEPHGVSTHLGRAVEAVSRAAPVPDAVWKDFERHAPEYYGLLGEVVDLRLDVDAAEGFLPAEIVARVHEQQLDGTFCRVSLRGYQSFGAKFALVQRKVIIGDEMGLGKTIQAIAAMAHLKALGRTHFLVVSPASVLVNWMREIAARSDLHAHRLHGPDRAGALAAWVRTGDVAVTTFGTLPALAIPDEVPVAMLVVDEAHYAKNPRALRSETVGAWSERAERALFLTGTPMENRAEEFANLVGYLQPTVAEELRGEQAVAGPAAFRRAVAPAYLRRNQDDVLTELPQLVRADEWVEFGAQDAASYYRAVGAGNFMAMRRAAYQPDHPKGSAKLRRLVDLVAEAAANGRKVVVFSYFRDVLDTVVRALGPDVLGPLTGSTSATDRLSLVDRLSRTDGHAVLVSQIQAGGVGLNMQAASVVILCEPQLKPTLEEQAIARTHRMGQVRSVQVHRLLAVDSVDQRLVELLGGKTRLFDQYARPSDIAAASPEALDISEVELARCIVAAEQERVAGIAGLAPAVLTELERSEPAADQPS